MSMVNGNGHAINNVCHVVVCVCGEGQVPAKILSDVFGKNLAGKNRFWREISIAKRSRNVGSKS